MTRQDLDAQNLDSWHSSRYLDHVRAPARHAVAAWALAAVFALAAILGPPATKQSAAAVLALRQDVIMLDRELARISVRLPRELSAADPALDPLGGEDRPSLA